jgi:predicted permease
MTFMSDLRHAIRTLLRHRGYSITAILTLALGIGATTAVFAVVDAVLINAVPYQDPRRLVDISHVAPGLGISGPVDLSGAQWFTYRDEDRLFEHIGLWSLERGTVTGLGPAEEVRRGTVSYGTLQALAQPPLLGRWFTETDDRPGAPATILLTHAYWQRKFAGDASIVGKTITVDSRPREVIGVMPRQFRLMNADVDVILPMRLDRSAQQLGLFNYHALGRLKRAATLEQARAEIARMDDIAMQSWPTPFGATDLLALLQKARFTPVVQPLRQAVVGNIERVLWLVMGTIAVVFLIAAANVANLMLVRAESRRQEFAVRTALGASRARIVREWLVEGTTLGICGAILGGVLAAGALRLLVALAPPWLPQADQIAFCGSAFAFAAVAALVGSGLSSLLPILTSRHREGDATLLRGRSTGADQHQHRARKALIVAEIAMSLVLLVAAGLTIRTVAALRGMQPSTSRPETVQLFNISIPVAAAGNPEAVVVRQNEIGRALSALPGVSGVSYANSAPLDISGSSHGPVGAQGAVYKDGHPPLREIRYAAAGFFRVIGMPILAGRELTADDIAGRHAVVVVSERLAREEWGSAAAAIGRKVREVAGPWRDVVGVVPDVRNEGLREEPQATVYYPVLTANLWGEALSARRAVTFAVRSDRAGSAPFVREVQGVVARLVPEGPISQTRTLRNVYDRALAPAAFTMIVLGIAATMAVLLGVVGIYGVVSYVVAQQTREIGIRAALGAGPQQLRRMFVSHAFVLASVGVAAGLAGAVAVTRLMSSLLFGVTPLDPPTFIAASALLTLAAALASYVPARRASKVDPMVALRYE